MKESLLNDWINVKNTAYIEAGVLKESSLSESWINEKRILQK